MKIITNKVQCKNCNDVIESKHVHDFVSCSCFRNKLGNKGIAVDGGREYLRRIGNLDNYIDLSEYKDTKI